MIETLLGLVSCYSPSGQEHKAVAWLVTRMQELGYSQSYTDAAGNAVGIIGNGPRQIILLGHIDTVPGEIPVRIEDGILYGRGAVDAKGPLACFVNCLARLGETSGWQFVLIGAVEEERNSEGARFIADKYKPDFAVIGEPNRWDRVALGYKGTASARLIVKRKQSHSAGNEQTAAEIAVEKWNAIQNYANKFNLEKSQIFNKILPALKEIHSGDNNYEQWASLSIGTRLPQEVTPQEWYNQLNNLAADTEIIPEGNAVPAWICEKNTLLVRALLSGIRAQGGNPSFVFKTGTSDLNIVAPAWQCPVLVYGPGDSSLDHTPDEYIHLDEYRKAIDVLENSLRYIIEHTR